MKILNSHVKASRISSCEFSYRFFILFLFTLSGSLTIQAQWIQQGPAPSKGGQVEGIVDREITGAINCVAPHPTDANILYVGGTNGGVWRTGNATVAGPTWTYISSDITSQSIGALEFDPTDAARLTLVVGSGRTSSIYGLGSGTRGIFRTITGLGPWTNIDVGGTFANRNVTGIAARGATIVVATNNGIYRTINTGGVWTQISGAVGTGLPAGISYDLVSDPVTNTFLYTNSGTSGIYKSTDTGATWVKVSTAAVDADLVGAGNLEMAVGNSNNVFLAIVRGGRLADLYRSGDGGTSWNGLDIPQTTETGNVHGIHVGGQGNSNLSLAADPTNSNVVYIGGDRQPWGREPVQPPTFPNSLGAQNYTGRLFRVNASLAAGAQAFSITHSGTAGNSAPHADSRDMDFNAGGDLIESDDGGVYIQSSPADATGNWISLNGNMSVTEFHSIDWDANANTTLGGAQDNAITQHEISGNVRWRNANNGDGGDVAVDDISSAANSSRYYSTQNLGNFTRAVYTSANAFTSSNRPALTNTATGTAIGGFTFVTPIKLNSRNGNRLLVATTGGVFESADQGTTVTSIGAIAINGTTQGGIDALAYGAADNVDIVYAGTLTDVHVRTAAGGLLTNAASYPGEFVQGIAVDPDDSRSAYVVDPNSVYETPDAGVTWTDVTGNLLTLTTGTFRTVAYVPNTSGDLLAVGTDLGVFTAPGPAFNVWTRLGAELPNVMVYDLEYDVTDNILLAGTLGRGAWTYRFLPADLYAKDRLDDDGTEPNPSTLPMWESPDIWVRVEQDAARTHVHDHENAEYKGPTDPNYVYVEVRNKGNSASAGTEKIHLYWAKAGSWLRWLDPWNGGIYFDPGPNTMLMGDVIATQTLPVVPGLGSTIVEFAWNPPDPDVYATAFGTQTNHFCLLARITTSDVSPFGMTTLETMDINSNVRSNNSIVWKNIGLYDAVAGPTAPAQAVMANMSKESMKIKFRFEMFPAEGKEDLFKLGCIMVKPAGTLAARLKKNPPSGKGIMIGKKGIICVMEQGATLENIILDPREFGLLNLQFMPGKSFKRGTPYSIRVTQLEVKGEKEEVIGGQTFVYTRLQKSGSTRK